MNLMDLVTSSNPIVGIVGEVAGKLIDRVFPDKVAQASERARMEAELLKITQEDKLDERAKETSIQLAQIAVNAKEAESESIFKAGWRPFVGWAGALSLTYVSILEPFMRFISTVVFQYMGTFPIIDTTITMQVLFALLGMGAYRSFDKFQGTAK